MLQPLPIFLTLKPFKMKAKRTAPAKSTAASAISQPTPESMPPPTDRPTDPLFVPHIELSEMKGKRAGADDYPEMLKSICGTTDDSQPVERYNGLLGVTTAFVAAHQAAVCQVQWNGNLASVFSNPGNVSGVRWGTGTMITDNIMIACGHLFDQTGGGWERPRQNGTTNIITPQEIARNMHVNFNYQVDASGTLRAEQSFPIIDLIEYRLGGVDMAICRIGGNPGAIFGRTQISPTDAAVSDMICIIGHPAGHPKRIEAGPVTSLSGNFIRYNDIDTLGGNSGSGILRASDGRLVGIHTNGGCTPASPGPSGGSNYGQRITAVIAASPTLRALLRPVPPKFKIRDDGGGGTIKFLDDRGTLKVLDDRGTLKFRDDLKQPAFDKLPIVDTKLPAIDTLKMPGDDKGIDHPGGHPNGPVRPFILANPHHSFGWMGEGAAAGELNDVESLRLQYESAIQHLQLELLQLEQAYGELLSQYDSPANPQSL